MANYLQSGGGRPSGSAPSRSKSSLIHVDPAYLTRIYSEDGEVDFTGYLPADFSLSLDAGWGGELAGAISSMIPGGEALESVGGAVGVSSRTKALTAKTWDAPSHLAIDLPIILDAYSSTQEEVMQPLVALMKLCAPGSNGGTLLTPGPTPASAIADLATGNSGTVKEAGEAVEQLFRGQKLTVMIGKFFKMSPVIVNSANAELKAILEVGSGNPIRAVVTLQVESYFAVTKADLDAYFIGAKGQGSVS